MLEVVELVLLCDVTWTVKTWQPSKNNILIKSYQDYCIFPYNLSSEICLQFLKTYLFVFLSQNMIFLVMLECQLQLLFTDTETGNLQFIHLSLTLD